MYHSVKFLRASKPFETCTGVSNDSKHVETSEREHCSNSSSGKEVRQFYENLLEGPNEKVKAEDNQTKSMVIEKEGLKSKERGLPAKKQIRRNLTLRPSDSRELNYFLKMAQDGDIDKLRKFIQDGMDINVADQFGWTALMCASRNGQKTCVKFLLEQGASIDLRNNKGQTAEDIAKCFTEVLDVFHKHRRRKQKRATIIQLTSASTSELVCDICQIKFSGTRQEHNSSTAHLFNCQYRSERTLYHIPETNIGFQLMKKKGWNQEKGLGPEGSGRKFPVKTVLKQDRLGLGSKRSDRAKVTHFSAWDTAAVNSDNHSGNNRRVSRRTTKRKLVQDQIKERKWEHDMRVYMNTE